jgi:hypothetical protein
MAAETDKGGILHSTCNETIRVTLPDIARGADASASSTENAEVKPGNVTDGDFFSRWSSEWSDPQWIEIDLRRLARVSGVTLVWETAYASGYDIRTSVDRKNWQTVFSTKAGAGGTEFIPFKPVDARYVRMSGNKRATTWGYSLWDFIVHGNN